MSVFLSPVFNDTQFKGDGTLAVGYKLYTYAAGSTTPLTTYTTSDGDVAQANPIVLNARGEVEHEIWMTGGLTYKIVLTTDSDVVVRTVDDISGTNDSSITIDQWIASGLTPTYVNATQFTLLGDQTSAFQVNRRIKATVTAGTVYAGITVSAYGALTTVTLDSAVLDSGLSAVSLGLITPENTSLPTLPDDVFKVSGSADLTKMMKFEVEGLTTATTRTMTVQDKDITIAGLDDVNGGAQLGSKIQDVDATVSGNDLTITINPTTLDFRSTTLTDGTPTTLAVTSAISVVVPDGGTLGTTSAIASRLAILAINNAGTIEAAVINLAGGNQLDETNLISTTTIGTGADSATVAYSTTGRSNVAYRVLGFIDITEATAGTWATAPTLVQGSGGQALSMIGNAVVGNAQNASGASFDFTGIPAWVTHLEVTVNGISLSGTDSPLIQLGDAGGIEATAYVANSSVLAAGVATTNYTTGIGIRTSAGGDAVSGAVIFTKHDGYTWVAYGVLSFDTTSATLIVAGKKTLSDTLTQFRFAATGANTYDAGSVSWKGW